MFGRLLTRTRPTLTVPFCQKIRDIGQCSSAPWATAWNTLCNSIGGQACTVSSSFITSDPLVFGLAVNTAQKWRMANGWRMTQPFGSNGSSRIPVFAFLSE